MKKLLLYTLFLAAIGVAPALCQTNLKSVMVDTNGVVVKPTNFWSANEFGQQLANRYSASFNDTMLVTLSNSGIVNITNNTVYATAESTNNASSGRFRLFQNVDSTPSGGVGTLWGSHNHEFTIVFDAILRPNAIIRSVIGHWYAGIAPPNTAIALTNRGIGLEFTNGGGDTNSLRIIAHDGTTATNGPWVSFGNPFLRQTAVLRHNRTNGQVSVLIGNNPSAPVLLTNATITGGPTNNGGILLSSWDIGTFQITSQTNGDSGITVYNAYYTVEP